MKICISDLAGRPSDRVPMNKLNSGTIVKMTTPPHNLYLTVAAGGAIALSGSWIHFPTRDCTTKEYTILAENVEFVE